MKLDADVQQRWSVHTSSRRRTGGRYPTFWLHAGPSGVPVTLLTVAISLMALHLVQLRFPGLQLLTVQLLTHHSRLG